MSNENLMIEVVGSSNKAISALDKVISKLTELQNKFVSVTPAITQFNNSLKSISNNFSLKTVINETIKASAEFQKMQSQSMVARQKHNRLWLKLPMIPKTMRLNLKNWQRPGKK